MTALLAQYRLLLLAAAVAVLMVVSAAGAWQWQANAYGKQIAGIERDQAKANERAETKARTEEQRRQTAIEVIRNDAAKTQAIANADAAAADATADSLRAELDRIKRRAAGCASATTGSATAESATGVLADLLSEVEAAGRAMAAEADRRGVAGGACELSYDAVKRGG